jgi:hypothetical protein
LTDSDPTDGAGGRHAPNNHRAFDLPNMTYLGNGKIDDGPLSTDRPHTAKVFGYYQLKWLGQETWIGFTQSAFQGSPVSTCLSVIGTSSACQWAEGRGGFVHFTRAANGDYVQGSINHSARTDPFFQTDLNIRHEVKLTERYRLGLEANVLNFLNQHSELAVDEFIFADTTNMVITPSRTPRFASDPGFDWNKVMRGFNYTQEVNAEGFTLRSRYGLPNVFQTARNFRLAVRFTF